MALASPLAAAGNGGSLDLPANRAVSFFQYRKLKEILMTASMARRIRYAEYIVLSVIPPTRAKTDVYLQLPARLHGKPLEPPVQDAARLRKAA